MLATEQQLLELIQHGESLTLEFKECKNAISRGTYETVCSFMNRHGGTLLLGISDSGDITGVDLNAIEKIKKDFVTAINNAQKIHPPAYLSIEEAVIHGKHILHIYIPESSQVHRCNGRIYDRNEDGDLDITDHTRQVAHLYQRKQSNYSENKVYPHVELKDLRKDLIDRCRKLASIGSAEHPWSQMSDMEFIQSAQLHQMDPETKKSGITLAGILLLGNDQLILSTLPHHRTDLILRKVDLDRYDDRDLVRTNLIESYDHIIAFVEKHLSDPFFLEGTNRISLRAAIFREVAANILIHREYTNAYPAKLIIEYGQVRTENANKPHGFGLLNPATITPLPKNPVIGAFFREIHRADELGSGIRKLMRYGKIYGGADPEMIEGDIFRITIKVPEFIHPSTLTTQNDHVIVTENGEPIVMDQVGTKLGPSQNQIEVMRNCLTQKGITELMQLCGRTNRTKFRDQVLQPLLQSGWVEMTIPDKPKSSKQKYRLTGEGQKLLQKER